MIRPLRARHRLTFVVMAAVLPVAFGAALLGRRPRAVGPLPSLSQADSEAIEFEFERTWSSLELHSRVARHEVQLVSWDAREAPDALLYWSPREPAEASLPAEALLVGALGDPLDAPRTLALPTEAAGRGWLVVYSLGHSEVLGHTALEGGG